MTERPATGAWPASAGSGQGDWPTVPGYEILEELGRGGMGVVYRARQVSLKRLVALKLIRDSALAGPQERARFRIEAEAAARMRHPNIVQVHEIGEHQGRPYFAMELLEGGSLDKHIAGRPQLAAQAAELVRTLALAVQHAHAQQVVHRDLKPANILFQESGVRSQESGVRSQESGVRSQESGVRSQGSGVCADRSGTAESRLLTPDSCLLTPDSCAKITDFGLAKRLDSQSTALTRDGAILGSAGYMAPEQAAGRSHEVGPAVDVYALGAILYELLTGRPPFQADSWNQALEQVLHDEPTPPTRWRADVPPELETVCLKCLEKAPGRRYTSAGELADDLGRYLEGRPVAAVPLGERERLARLAARDGYQLVDEIGRGPRSTVYRALHGPLEQPVALKVFAAGACTREEWGARFQRGADLWAALAHPNIVALQRTGWWDGVAYVAVEYVPYGSLAAKLAGEPYSLLQALRLVEQLAEIVSYLHRQGIVHGNLKPSNVLLAADGIPRVSDFRPTGGLFQGPLPVNDPQPAGLGYLAPELVGEPGAELRPHTDIYGLGMILYELLTGRPPFGGATAQETLDQVRALEPVPPSRLNAEVTPHLEAFCLRCLRKNPWRRYHRAYDLVTRLQYFQDNPEGRPMHGERRPKRRPLGREDTPHAT